MGVVGLHPPIPSWDAYPLTLDYHKTASEWAFEAILDRLKRWNLEIEFAPLRCAHGCCGGGNPHTPDRKRISCAERSVLDEVSC